MEIIIHNVLTYQCCCRNCTSVFRFEEKEAKWDYGDYTSPTSVSLKCPVCSEHLFFKQSDLKKVIVHKTKE